MMKVAFSKPKKWKLFSWGIMKFLGINYSHAVLIFDVRSTGQNVVYHANVKGVNCLKLETFLKENMIVGNVVEIEDPELRTSALKFCIDKLGLPYSMMTILSIAFKLKSDNGERAFICSELVARALGMNIENIDQIDPEKLREILDAKN